DGETEDGKLNDGDEEGEKNRRRVPSYVGEFLQEYSPETVHAALLRNRARLRVTKTSSNEGCTSRTSAWVSFGATSEMSVCGDIELASSMWISAPNSVASRTSEISRARANAEGGSSHETANRRVPVGVTSGRDFSS